MALVSVFELLASAAGEEEPQYFQLLRERCYEAALPALQQAIAQGDARAMGFYGALLSLGEGIDQDRRLAATWFHQGAAHGDVFSQLAFGVCLASGLGVQTDQQEAAYWLYQAAIAGHPVAIGALSDIVGQNPGVVGPHFSIEEYHDLMAQLRAPAVLH